MARITDLTANSSLASGDLLVVVDIDDATMDATGTDKKLAISDLSTFILGTPVTSTGQPANPAATASLTLVMMGTGTTCKITPASTGKVQVTITGLVFTNTAAVNLTFGARFGTGTAPANGVAVTGTRWGSGTTDLTTRSAALAVGVPFALTDLLTLTPATAYWFDIALLTSAGADTAAVTNLSFVAREVA